MAYVEVEIRGAGERAVGFVEGFRAGRGDARPVWYCDVQGVGHSGLLEALRQKLGRLTHLVAPEDLARDLGAAIAASAALGLEVAGSEPVGEAEVEVEVECFSAEVGAELRRLAVSDLPAGVVLEAPRLEEKSDPDARGTEGYAPAHHYTLLASGRYVGPVEGVLAVVARLEGRDFVRLGPVRMRRTP